MSEIILPYILIKHNKQNEIKPKL